MGLRETEEKLLQGFQSIVGEYLVSGRKDTAMRKVQCLRMNVLREVESDASRKKMLKKINCFKGLL
jgi:hypothetical protein